MTKHILDKVAASLQKNSRIGDCKRTLAEAETEHAELDTRIAEADRNSTNPSVEDSDARQAVERVNDFRLLQRRLARGIDELRTVIEQKEEARRSEERVTAYSAAKAERDALTERWLKEGASAYALLIQLIADSHSNDQVISQANRLLPEGAERLRSAELEARGPASEERWQNGEQFTRFTSLEHHRFDRSGFAWSLRERERREIAELANQQANRAATVAAAREAANKPEVLAAKAAAEAARYSRFTVSQARYTGAGRIKCQHRDGLSWIGGEIGIDAPILWMHADQVDDARGRGLKVEPAPLKETPAADDGDYLPTLGRGRSNPLQVSRP